MASRCPSGGSRRGLISCLRSSCCGADDAPQEVSQQAVYNLIAGFYAEAFDRLPCEAVPGLARSLGAAGFCLGLLDPVSNIVLNAVSLLSPGPDDPDRAPQTDPPWHQVSCRSYHSLVDLMITYFGCLTKEQALRYLWYAGADLVLAAMLVEHDLYAADERGEPTAQVLLDPASARTQAALKSAALKLGHPAPDTLLQVMTSPLPTSAAPSLQLLVSGGRLTPDDVSAIHRLLRRQSTRPCDAQVTYGQGVVVLRVRREVDESDDNVTRTTSVDVSNNGHTTTTTTTFRRAGEPITSLRCPGDMAAKMSACLMKAEEDAQKYSLDTTSPCGRGDACEYLQSLKMRLHDTIHASYVQALALLLPCTSAGTTGGSLMRIILVAGHCCGSMDPVSNIIVNSIWYLTRRPLPEPDRSMIEPYTDILDTVSLLRTEASSLKGLTDLVRATVEATATSRPESPTGWALETLCRAKCDISDILSSSRKLEKNPFEEAAMAAGHPLPTDLGLLHQKLLLRPALLGELRALTSQTSTIVSIDHIASILDKAFSSSTPKPVPVDLQAPELHAKALSAISRKRSKYEARRSFFRSKLEQLLEEYASQQFWEPKYRVNFICGVEEIGGGSTAYGKRYSINFMAGSESPFQINTLFFAEFGGSRLGYRFGNHDPNDAKPDFCCPLPPPYTGRCYYGSHSARKLVYPNLAEYLKGDITAYGTGHVADMLETDLVYFSSEGDVEFAEKLNSYYEPDSPASWSRPLILDDEESSGRQHFSSILPFCKQPELA